jgi:hypothetical protein
MIAVMKVWSCNNMVDLAQMIHHKLLKQDPFLQSSFGESDNK